MQLFSANATMFLKKVGKNTLKSCSEFLKSTFFPYCPDCPNNPNRRVPVPKCGLLTNCMYNWAFHHTLPRNYFTGLTFKSPPLLCLKLSFQLVVPVYKTKYPIKKGNSNP